MNIYRNDFQEEVLISLDIGDEVISTVSDLDGVTLQLPEHAAVSLLHALKNNL